MSTQLLRRSGGAGRLLMAVLALLCAALVAASSAASSAASVAPSNAFYYDANVVPTHGAELGAVDFGPAGFTMQPHSAYDEPAPLRAKIASDGVSCPGSLCKDGLKMLQDMPRPFVDGNAGSGVPQSVLDFDFGSSDSTNYLSGLVLIGIAIPAACAILLMLTCLGFCCGRSCCNCCGQRIATQAYSAKQVLCIRLSLAVWFAGVLVVAVLAIVVNHATSAGLTRTMDSADRSFSQLYNVADAVEATAQPISQRADQIFAFVDMFASVPKPAAASTHADCFRDGLPSVDAQGTTDASLLSTQASVAALTSFSVAAGHLGPMGDAALALATSHADVFTPGAFAGHAGTVSTGVTAVDAAVIDADAPGFFAKSATAAWGTALATAHLVPLASASESTSALRSLQRAAELMNTARQTTQPAEALDRLRASTSMSQSECADTLARLRTIRTVYADLVSLQDDRLDGAALATWLDADMRASLATSRQSAAISVTQVGGVRDQHVGLPAATAALRQELADLETLENGSASASVRFVAAVVPALRSLYAAYTTTYSATVKTAVGAFGSNMAANSAALVSALDSADAALGAVPAVAMNCLPGALRATKASDDNIIALPTDLRDKVLAHMDQIIAQLTAGAAAAGLSARIAALRTSISKVRASLAAGSTPYTQYSDNSAGLGTDFANAGFGGIQTLGAETAALLDALTRLRASALLSAYNARVSTLTSLTVPTTAFLTVNTSLWSTSTSLESVLTPAYHLQSALLATATHVNTLVNQVSCAAGNGFATASPTAIAALTVINGGLTHLVNFKNAANSASTAPHFANIQTKIDDFAAAINTLTSGGTSSWQARIAAVPATYSIFSADALPADPLAMTVEQKAAQASSVVTPASIHADVKVQLAKFTAARAAVAHATTGLVPLSTPATSVLNRLVNEAGTNKLRDMGPGLNIVATSKLGAAAHADAAVTAYPYAPLVLTRVSAQDITALRAYITAVGEVANKVPVDTRVRATALAEVRDEIENSAALMDDLVNKYFDKRSTIKGDVYVVDEQRLLFVDILILITLLFVVMGMFSCCLRKHKPMMMMTMLLFPMTALLFLLAMVHLTPGMLLGDVCVDVPITVSKLAGNTTIEMSTLQGIVAYVGANLTQEITTSELALYVMKCEGDEPEFLTVLNNVDPTAGGLKVQALGDIHDDIDATLAQAGLTMGPSLSASFAGLDTLSEDLAARARGVYNQLNCDATSPLLTAFLETAMCEDFSGAFAILGCLLFLLSVCMLPGMCLGCKAFKRLNKANLVTYDASAKLSKTQKKYAEHKPVALKPGFALHQLKGFTPEAAASMNMQFGVQNHVVNPPVAPQKQVLPPQPIQAPARVVGAPQAQAMYRPVAANTGAGAPPPARQAVTVRLPVNSAAGDGYVSQTPAQRASLSQSRQPPPSYNTAVNAPGTPAAGKRVSVTMVRSNPGMPPPPTSTSVEMQPMQRQ